MRREFDGNKLLVTPTGTISDSLGNLTALTGLTIANTHLTGNLHEDWGDANSFTQLHSLVLFNNSLDGPLPLSWGNINAFPLLSNL